MNNLQHIVKDNTRFAMHMAVELCERGDFDSVNEALRWLMKERDDVATPSGGLTENRRGLDVLVQIEGGGRMTATDDLRKMLDERGVEWTYADGTVSFADNGRWYHAWEYNDGAMCVSMGYLTPEQAIAATLDDDAYDAVANEHVITAEQLHALLDEWDKHPGRAATDGEMMTYSTLGGGECEVEETKWLSYGGEGCDTYRHTLSCGHVSETFDEEPPNFCCECGAKVKAVKR